jgi:tRNA A-37 threonylcarbamoyl transferase component Bud32
VTEEDKRATAGKVAALIAALRAARLSHGDLKATNVLLSPAGPVLIDIDALRAHRSAAAFERAHAKDLARFMRNWESDPQLSRMFEEALAR